MAWSQREVLQDVVFPLAILDAHSLLPVLREAFVAYGAYRDVLRERTAMSDLRVSDTDLIADVKEVDLGNLMIGSWPVQRCSNCESIFNVYSGINGVEFPRIPNYCPACGARTTNPNKMVDSLRRFSHADGSQEVPGQLG